MVPWERTGGAAQASLALQSFETSGNNLLGYVAGLGVVLGVLALIIIGGRMIHANFTGDPWIAARGMAELPYVVLAVVLIAGSGGLTAMLFEGSLHHPEEDVSTSIQALVEEQAANEREAADCEAALQSENGTYLCPDDDGWEQLANTVPLSGDKDPRCTRDGAEDCYEYCYTNGSRIWTGQEETGFWGSPCSDSDYIEQMESASWIWSEYHCANLNEELWNRLDACPDAPDRDDIPDDLLRGSREKTTIYRYYICENFPEWVAANSDVEVDHGGPGDSSRNPVSADYCDTRYKN
ncbi:TrbC/VirB2 family protein [Nocardiopsis sp. CNS-639]|uniref:TrbC/VirB2 family protein n=1 Tax=Nocardiopsis sp. CNS-639 TaxID=1169153 RepID=UPI00036C7182|nr:TrbC/VirB2 family protein [Nocardiopsis sp. CNS-639]